MRAIRLKRENLNRRRKEIERMLKPLRADKRGACDITYDKHRNGMVLGVHDGPVTDRDYRKWRFRSIAKDVWCKYFEVWNDDDPRSGFSLARAYFTLFITNRENNQLEELLCIHCDPDDQSDMKRGPHLHVTKAAHPLPKCHIPLNYGHLNDVLKSMQTLDRAMCKAIVIVATEVIPRFPANA